jgi:hypothetical protein
MRLYQLVWKLAAIVFVALFSPLPLCAQGVGAIAGNVTDASGSALPGATVTLSSPQGTVGANQQTVSDERGAYQFLRLQAGTYIVKGELSGFRPVELRDILVNANATARADLRLEIGSIAEALTVTGEAPLLDTTSALKQTVITRDELEALPNRVDIWSVTRVMPSVIMNKVDVGGSQMFLQSQATTRGTTTESGYFIDGLDVSGQDGNGGNAVLYIDPYAFQESTFQFGGAGQANTNKGGLLYNVISRSGTNQLHGGGTFNGTNRRMNASNISENLKTELLAGLNPAARALAQNRFVGNEILKLYDYGAWVGGPVIKDRLWFSGSTHIQGMDQYPLGSFDAKGNPVIDDYLMSTTTAKISWQMTKSAQLSYFDNLHYKGVYHRNGVGNNNTNFSDNLARTLNTKWPNVQQVKFTTPWRSSFVIDIAYARLRDDDRFDPRPEVSNGAISRFDSATNTFTEAWPTYNFNLHRRDQAHASISYFAGAHDIRAGYSIFVNGKPSAIWSTSAMRADYVNGQPNVVRTYNVAIYEVSQAYDVQPLFTQGNREQGYYIQDKWTPTRKLVVNYGVRFESNYGWQDATCQPVTVFFTTGKCFDAIKGAPDLKNVLPRFAVVYDVKGDGRTAVKFAANRYDQPIQMEFVGRLNPVGSTSDQRQWLPQSRCGEVNVRGCDRNGDLIPQIDELGPSGGFALGSTARYAGDLKYPVSNEFNWEVQRQLPGNMVLSLGYTHRETRRNLGQRNMAVPEDTYVPITVTEPVSGRTVTVYNQSPALAGRNDTLWSNEDILDSNYNGGDITINKRMSDGWSLMAGASYGKSIGEVVGGDLNNPNSKEFRRGLLGNDVPWSYRLSGVYDLPYNIASMSGTMQYYKGVPESTTVLVGAGVVPGGLTQVTQSLVVLPRGEVRLPNVFSLDFSFRKPVRMGNRSFEPRIDLYNLTNEATKTNWLTQLGGTYHRASTIQAGRMIKVGFNFEF